MNNLNTLKAQLLNLYKPEHETSEECWDTFEQFINLLFKENDMTEQDLEDFRNKTTALVIDKYNNLITLFEMSECEKYQLDRNLDEFASLVSLYGCALAVAKGTKKCQPE